MKSKWVLSTIIIFCIFIAFKANAQMNSSSTKLLRGYVLRQFSKQNIVNRLTLGDDNSPIDSYQKTFFLPFGELSLDGITDSLNVIQPEFIVFMPSKETNEWINEFCMAKVNLIENNFPSYKSDSSYFEITGKNDESFLWQYYFIECKAVKISIPNNSKNTFQLNIPYNELNINLNCYFVFDIMILQPINSINSKRIHLFEVNQKISPHESGHISINY